MFFFLPPIQVAMDDGGYMVINMFDNRKSDDGADNIDFVRIETHKPDGEELITHFGLQGRSDHLKEAGVDVDKCAKAAATAGIAVATVGVAVAAGCPAAAAAAGTAFVATAMQPDLVDVEGYHRDDGTWVRSHSRTHPDGWEGNNFS